MADAQATFVATLDTSSLQASARSGLTALQRMGLEIQKRSKDLAALKSAQARLLQSAGVQEYLKRQKAIERNEAFEAKTIKRVADLRAKYEAAENLGIAKQSNVAPEELKQLQEAAAKLGVTADDVGKLAEESEKASGKLAEVKKELDDLRQAQDALAAGDKGVAAFRDQAKVIKENEAQLADLQAQYSAAGGSATELAGEIKEPTKEVTSFLEKAKKAPGPIGEFASKLDSLKSAAKAAGPIALVAIFVAIAVAVAKATVELVKFAVASADAARNAARMRSNAAFGSTVGVKEIEGAMAVLRENTALSKDEAQALASELYRLGDRGDRLAETALTIERFGQLGDDARQSVKELYDELRKPTAAMGVSGPTKSMIIDPSKYSPDVFDKLAGELGRKSVDGIRRAFSADKGKIGTALANIGDKYFADPAIAQMTSLEAISKRWEDAKGSLFSGINAGPLLAGLKKLVDLFDESTESGQDIRTVFATIGQPIIDALSAAMPIVKAFFDGFEIAALYLVLYALEAKNALVDMIPQPVLDAFQFLSDNIDLVSLAVYAGIIAFGLFVGLIGTVIGLVLSVIGPAIAFGAAIVALGAVIIAAWSFVIDSIGQTIEDLDEYFDISDTASAIIDGLINGLADGASALFKAFEDLASGAFKAFKDVLGIKSPSLAFRLAAREIPRGAALGVDDEAPELQTSVASMTSPGDMTSASGARGGGGITFVVQPGAIVLQGVQGAEELQDEGFLRKLGRALIGAAREGGLSPEPKPA